MKLNIKSFRNAKPLLIKIYKTSGISRARETAVMSGVHLIAFYTFLHEEFPCNEFEVQIESLMKFYQITEVFG